MPDGFKNAVHRRRIHRLAGEGAVEIDDVQVLEALRFECMRLRGRVAMKHGRARHVALLEPHGEAFFQIDGGERESSIHLVIPGRREVQTPESRCTLST